MALLDDEVVRLKRDIERHEVQLKQIDVQIDGSARTDESPDGFEGITQNLDGLRELHGMVKEYISHL